MTTNPDLDQARKWAKDPSYQGDVPSVAAAHVIASLPDEWIDAEKLAGQAAQLRALYNAVEHTSVDKVNDLSFRALVSTIGAHVEMLEALLPAPAPRTLADMTTEERETCRFMAAEVITGRTWFIIGENPAQPGWWIVVTRSGRIESRLPEHITPLPDLPRMVWPDEQATEEDMSIIPPEIDTSTGHDDDVDMAPEDAPDGYYLVRWWGEEHPVPAEKVQGQWWVIGKPSMLPAKDVLIVSRLIPEGEQA